MSFIWPRTGVSCYGPTARTEEKACAEVNIDAGVQKIPACQSHLLCLFCRLNCYFMKWAELKGAGCEECMAIAQIFAKGVDASKSGAQRSVPEHLEPPLDVSMCMSLKKTAFLPDGAR